MLTSKLAVNQLRICEVVIDPAKVIREQVNPIGSWLALMFYVHHFFSSLFLTASLGELKREGKTYCRSVSGLGPKVAHWTTM